MPRVDEGVGMRSPRATLCYVELWQLVWPSLEKIREFV